MTPKLIEALKELLVIIDELRIIDDPDITRQLLGIDGLIYSGDFVDAYEDIRSELEALGILPNHLAELPRYEE
jgi:hypothetical protein